MVDAGGSAYQNSAEEYSHFYLGMVFQVILHLASCYMINRLVLSCASWSCTCARMGFPVLATSNAKVSYNHHRV